MGGASLGGASPGHIVRPQLDSQLPVIHQSADSRDKRFRIGGGYPNPNVRITCAVNHDRVLEFYEGADVFAIASRRGRLSCRWRLWRWRSCASPTGSQEVPELIRPEAYMSSDTLQ